MGILFIACIVHRVMYTTPSRGIDGDTALFGKSDPSQFQLSKGVSQLLGALHLVVPGIAEICSAALCVFFFCHLLPMPK
jgi:hypothetical protein